ncbi:uncharacterized protein LOC116341430 isoform X3 [Contarinia nasturtii]|uniref:uncharacterized protein LOC116341430 isoform X3 n=1 Tax=Contarinia nasturtii TaxID=265458 RepID=UPI0012D3782F|nr:uncharacterized protein LOC116341430 isoform X3 [Contarinia nasturtii]
MSDTSSGDDDDGDEECGVERGNVVSNLANNQPVVRLERMSRDLLRQWNVPRPNVTQQTPARRSKRVQTVPSVARSSQPQDSSDDEPLAAKIRRTTQPSNSVSNLANNQPVVRLQRMSNDLLRQWNVPRPSVTQQTPARRSKRVQTVPSVARSLVQSPAIPSTSAAPAGAPLQPLRNERVCRRKGEQSDPNQETFTIKMSLRSFLRNGPNDPTRIGGKRNKDQMDAANADNANNRESDMKRRLMAIIDNAVIEMSDLTRLSAYYVHNELNRLVDSNNDAAIRAEFLAPFDAHKYFFALKHCQANVNCPLNPVFAQYLRDKNSPVQPHINNLTHPISFAYQQSATNMRNNTNMHGNDHIRNYFKRKNIMEQEIDVLMDYLQYEDSEVELYDGTRAHLTEYYDELHPLLPLDRIALYENDPENVVFQDDHLIPRGWLWTTTDDTKYYKHVHELIHLQRWIQQHNVANPNEQWRSFRAIPQSKNKRKHVQFDTEGFIDMTNLLYARREDKVRRSDKPNWDNNDYDTFWNRYVNLRKINRNGQIFGNYFTTDGVTACLRMIRRKRDATSAPTKTSKKNNKKKKGKKQYEKKEPPKCPEDIKAAFRAGQITKIIGDDPGAKVSRSTTSRDLKSTLEWSYKLTAKQWYAKSGARNRKHRLRRYTGVLEDELQQKRNDLHALYGEQPSSKSANHQLYLEYNLDSFMASRQVHYQRRVARLELDKHIRRQVAAHQVARDMTLLEKEIPKAQQTIVYALGDAKIGANSPIKGHCRTPQAFITHTIDRYCRIMAVHEPGTSMLCSRDHDILDQPLHRERPENMNPKDRFLVCNNCEPALNHVLPPPNEWIGKIHHTFRSKHRLELEPNLKHYGHSIANQQYNGRKQTIVFDRDLNASRNMIYKSLCMIQDIPINGDFNRSAAYLRQRAANAAAH